MRARRPLVRDRNAAICLGLAAYLAGTVLLWDAWEHRGKSRPWPLKLPGMVFGG